MKTQLSENKSRVKKSKEKGKRKDAAASNVTPPQGDNELTAEELVMTATGCKVQKNMFKMESTRTLSVNLTKLCTIIIITPFCKLLCHCSNILSKGIIPNNTRHQIFLEFPLNSTESLKRRFYKIATQYFTYSL